jgi:hypothetical protein
MTYRPKILKQGDGSQCQWHNCSPTSHAMAVDRDWLGARRAAPSKIRTHINAFCPGTTMGQNKAAIGPLYGTVTHPMFEISWQTFVDGIVAGRGAVVSTLYKVVHGTPFDSCRTFDGHHAIYVNERRWNATLNRYEFLVFDPLADHRFSWIPQGPQWWPGSLLQRAMLAALNDGGFVSCAFTRNTQNNVKKALYAGGFLRSGAGVNFGSKAGLVIGSLCTVAETVNGGPWTVNNQPGTAWYRITAVSGQSASSLFDSPSVFAAKGWFTGPTGAT